jgi:hypothetical protein
LAASLSALKGDSDRFPGLQDGIPALALEIVHLLRQGQLPGLGGAGLAEGNPRECRADRPGGPLALRRVIRRGTPRPRHGASPGPGGDVAGRIVLATSAAAAAGGAGGRIKRPGPDAGFQLPPHSGPDLRGRRSGISPRRAGSREGTSDVVADDPRELGPKIGAIVVVPKGRFWLGVSRVPHDLADVTASQI